jgi:hypothetical protein
MKKIRFITGITLTVVLATLGCTNPTGGTTDTPSGNLGTGPLTLKGIIHAEVLDYVNYNYSYTPVNKNGTLNANTGETGSITAGSFEIELEEPTPTTSFTAAQFPYWDNVQFSNESAKYAQVLLSTSGSIGSKPLGRMKRQISVNTDTMTQTQVVEAVDYYYVSADITITGTAKKTQQGTADIISQALNMSFKKGWNATCLKTVATYGSSGMTAAVTFTTSNPTNLYWIIDPQ